jgi:hypothetical protein
MCAADTYDSTHDLEQPPLVVAGHGDEYLTVSGTDSKEEKSRARHPRASSRRYNSKSVPANRVEESMDGTHDSDGAIISSGEGQPLLGSSSVIVRVASSYSSIYTNLI